MAKFNQDDFSEEDFDDLIEAENATGEEEEIPTLKRKKEPVQEEEEQEEVKPQMRRPVQAPIPAKPLQKQQPQQQMKRPAMVATEERQAPMKQERMSDHAERPAPKVDRYQFLSLEKRYVILDNTTGQPYAESQNIENLTLGLLNDILNKLDRIEGSL